MVRQLITASYLRHTSLPICDADLGKVCKSRAGSAGSGEVSAF